MTPSLSAARTIVDELARGGVREAVLCPGSRNAPFSYALWEADRDGLLRLHVRIDERTAAFLALGLSKASGRPVPVVTTSGTAVANLHPAVLEADRSGAALVVLTADRPPELRGSGANQTVDQVRLFGGAVRWSHDLAVPDGREAQGAYWRATTCRLLAAASGALDRDPGPVHLNLPLREPLVPTGASGPASPGRADGAPWTRVSPVHGDEPAYDGPERTLVVVACADPVLARAAQSVAAAHGWPLVAEPVSGLAGTLPSLLLTDTPWLQEHRPDRLLVVGRPTLGRAVQALLRRDDVAVDVVTEGPSWADPASAAMTVHAGLAPSAGGPIVGDYLLAWRAAAARVSDAVSELLASEPWPTGPAVASIVSDAASEDALLVLGSSSVVRHLDVVGLRHRCRVVANRGVAGIDGTISTAVGAALAHQREHPGAPAYALVGDLTFLHDATGLMIGPGEPRPDLSVVVLDDDGGSIFAGLEPGTAELAEPFERVFATPTGADIGALCAASGTAHVPVGSAEELTAAVRRPAGVAVVHVRADRARARERQERLTAAVRRALTGPA